MSDDHSFAARVIGGASEPHSATGDPSRDQVRLHELRSLFETFLPEWKEEELAAVDAIQDDFQTQQLRLESLLEHAALAPDEYASAVNAQMSLFLQRSATILGQARAKQLFGVEDLSDIVIVDPERMRASKAPEVANRLSDSNGTLPWRPASVSDERKEASDSAHREQDVLRRRRLYEAIARLPQGQRQCVDLWISGLPHEQIAKTLHITIDDVKARLNDARELLRLPPGESPFDEQK